MHVRMMHWRQIVIALLSFLQQHLAGRAVGRADDVHAALGNLDFMTGKGAG